MGQLVYKDGEISCVYDVEIAKHSIELTDNEDRHIMTMVNLDEKKIIYREVNVDYISVLELYKIDDGLYYGEWHYDEGSGKMIGYVKAEL